jgi:hypothetical protein
MSPAFWPVLLFKGPLLQPRLHYVFLRALFPKSLSVNPEKPNKNLLGQGLLFTKQNDSRKIPQTVYK